MTVAIIHNTGDTNEFILFCLLSLATRRERHNSWKPMLTILCWHPTTHNEFCGVYDLKLSLPVETQTDLIWSDPKNSTATFNGQTSTELFLKSSNSRDRLFWVWRQPPTQFTLTTILARFLSGSFIMTDDDCQILSARARKWSVCIHLNQRHRVVQSLTKLNNKI